MRILLVTPYRHHAGGVESVNGLLIQTLRDLGHQVEILDAETYDGGPLLNLRLSLESRVFGLAARTRLKYKRHARARSHDLVIANGEFGFGIDHPRSISLFHGSYAGFLKLVGPHLSFRSRLAMKRLSWVQRQSARRRHVVAVSDFLKRILNEDGIRVSHVIRNAIDTERFSPSTESGPTGEYLFVGSFHYYGKGFDILERLAAAGLSITAATNVDPGRGIRRLKQVPHDRMPQVYQSHRMLIFPSRFEACQMSPLESMCCGRPVVMSRVGIAEDVEREIPEFVLPPDATPAEYIARIRLIEADYSRFARSARAYVLKHHGLAQYRAQWSGLLEGIRAEMGD